MDQHQRHLAAILFTDIVGYTSMMQENEVQAVSAIKRHNLVLERLASSFHGSVANYFGDGSLCIFQSATEAVQCALELQKELQKEPRVPLRVGLHIGEVFFEDDKAIGDGVNIASRIQSLGQANTILLSKEIADKIRNHPEFKMVSLGSFEFKNVNESLEVFALSNEGLHVPKRHSLEGKLKSPNRSLLKRKRLILVSSFIFIVLVSLLFLKKFNPWVSKPAVEKSIAVLPFTNMSNDKDQEYFSEGIADDILDHLAKISDLKVKSRTSTLRYKGSVKTIPEIGDELGVGAILEGSVRKSGNMVRIVVQLIDTKADDHIFSQTYDREIKDVLTTQSEIAMEIADALQAKLSDAEKHNLTKQASVDITAYDYYLKARNLSLSSEFKKEDRETGIQLLRSAIALDSNYASAYALMSVFYHFGKVFGLPRVVWMDSALLLSNKAIGKDPQLSDGYVSRIILFRDEGRLKDAENDLKIAYKLAPNDGLVMLMLSTALFAKHEYKEGFTLQLKALENLHSKKDPEYFLGWGEAYHAIKDYKKAETFYLQALNLSPGSAYILSQLARMYSDEKKYDQSVNYFEKSLSIDPTSFQIIDALAWDYFRMGNIDKAEANWSKYKEIESTFSDTTQFVPFRHRLAYIKWIKGKKEEANKLFDEQLRLDLRAINHNAAIAVWANGSDAYDYADINAFRGKKEIAYRWLDTALAKEFFIQRLIDEDPLLNSIRAEKRFNEYVARGIKQLDEAAIIQGIKDAIKEYEEVNDKSRFNITKLN
jgi:TolB-like protein/class 3 adenylate cyclase/Tfp pilus assembly protein PilF